MPESNNLLERLAPYAKRQAGLFVVPSDSVAFELRQLFLKDKKAILGEVFIPYHHFIKKLADPEKPVISQGEQTLLLHKILKEQRLSYFKSASIGIARQAAEAITTLKKNFILADNLKHIIGSKKVEGDLLTLFERYEEEKADLLDEGDLTLLALKRFKDSPLLQGIEFIAFDEFYHMSPGQLKFIESLVQNLKQTEILVNSPDLKISSLNKMPKIENFVLRSPFQEMRFIASKIAAAIKEGTSPQKIAICLRRGSHTLIDIMKELERFGLASQIHRLDPPFAAPILNESLSGTLNLPQDGTIEEFSILVTKTLKNYTGLNPRGLISIFSMGETLKSLSLTSQMLKLGKISRETFLNILFTNCSSSFASQNEISQVTPVKIIYFEDGSAISPDILFIPQMIEGHLPSSTPERLFFAHETAIDKEISNIFPSPHDILEHETFILKKLVARTKGQLIFMHPAIDQQGKETIASSFLDEYEKPIAVDTPSFNFVSPPQNAIEIEEERTLGKMTHPEYHGCLKNDHTREMIKKRFTQKALTPSQIETYAECPFKFFAEYVLNLKPLEEVTPEIQPKDLGTIIHAVLERFYKNHLDLFKKSVGDKKNIPAIEHTLGKIVDEVFEVKAMLIGYVADGLMPYERKIAMRLAFQVILSDIDTARSIPHPLFPHNLEWSFGNLPETMLKIKMEREPDALICGRVDRIDTTDDLSVFTVIDYKTGRNIQSITSKIKNGLHLQIPLYVEAVRQFLLPNSDPVGGMIFSVRQPDTKHGFLKKSFNNVHYFIGRRPGSILDDEKWDELRNTALTAVSKHVSSIRAADFCVRPRKCRDYCDYKDVCRYSPDQFAEAGDSSDR